MCEVRTSAVLKVLVFGALRCPLIGPFCGGGRAPLIGGKAPECFNRNPDLDGQMWFGPPPWGSR
jgi:hypothetical protein